MNKSHAPDIRALLRINQDGMSVSQINAVLKDISSQETIRNCLVRMPDTYIDRWVKAKRGQYEAIWCAVIPPPDCPYPTNRKDRKGSKDHDQGIPSKD